MQCPVCENRIQDEYERFCCKCGWRFRFFISGVSEEEEALYYKELGIVRKNWQDLQSAEARKRELEQEVTESRANFEQSRNTLGILTQRVGELEHELANRQTGYEQKMDEFLRKIGELEIREAELRRQLEESEQRGAALKELLKKEKTERAAAETLGSEVQRELDDLRQTIMKLKQDIVKYESDHTKMELIRKMTDIVVSSVKKINERGTAQTAKSEQSAKEAGEEWLHKGLR